MLHSSSGNYRSRYRRCLCDQKKGARAGVEQEQESRNNAGPERKALRQNVADDVSIDVGQAKVATGVAIGEPLVVDSQEV